VNEWSTLPELQTLRLCPSDRLQPRLVKAVANGQVPFRPSDNEEPFNPLMWSFASFSDDFVFSVTIRLPGESPIVRHYPNPQFHTWSAIRALNTPELFDSNDAVVESAESGLQAPVEKVRGVPDWAISIVRTMHEDMLATKNLKPTTAARRYLDEVKKQSASATIEKHLLTKMLNWLRVYRTAIGYHKPG
jgi:hypothetical protein